MADYNVFNPQSDVTPIPDWTRSIGQPVSQPLPDVSKGKRFETIGEGIEGAAKGAEGVFENWVTNRVRAGVEADQQATISAYEEIRNAQIQGRKPDPQAVRIAGFDGSLMSGTGTPQNLPPDLTAGLDKANQFGLAKAQGKGNDTLYTGAIYNMARQLRQQFPGHADFIDEQISKITHNTQANQYMQNLLIDINRGGQGQDVFMHDMFQKAFTNEYFGDRGVQSALTNLKINPTAENANKFVGEMYRRGGELHDQESWKWQHERAQGNKVDDTDQAKYEATKIANQIVSKHMSPIFNQSPAFDTPDKLTALLDASAHGENPISGKSWVALGAQVTAAKAQAIEDIENQMIKLGYKERIGPDMEGIRKEALTRMTSLEEAINGGNLPAVLRWKKQNEAGIDDTRKQFYDSDIGNIAKVSKVYREELGPKWSEHLDALSLSQSNITKDMDNFILNSMKQSGLPPEKRFARDYGSLYDGLVHMREQAAQGAQFAPRAYTDMVKNVDLLTQAMKNPTPQNQAIAKNMVEYMFNSDNNAKIMQFFDKEMGAEKGRQYVYQQMTNPDVVDAIHNLHDNNSWQMFKDWQLRSFKTYFNDNIQELNTLTAGMAPVQIHWNTDTPNHPRLEIYRKQPGGLVMGSTDENKVVNRLNSGISNLSYMAQKEGSNPTEFAWDTLVRLGYQPNVKTTGDLGSDIMGAIRSGTDTHKKQMEEAMKKLKEGMPK